MRLYDIPNWHPWLIKTFSEKQIQDLKDTYEAVTTSYDDIKDKKIIELAKNKRNLLLQIDSLRTKAAKASESA